MVKKVQYVYDHECPKTICNGLCSILLSIKEIIYYNYLINIKHTCNFRK